MKQQWQLFCEDLRIAIRLAWWLATVLVVLTILRWYGFSPWTFENVGSVMTAIRWDHLAALLIACFVYSYSSKIGSLLDRLRSSKLGKDGIETQFDPIHQVNQEQAVQANTNDRLTVKDVEELLQRVPHIDSTKISSEAAVTQSWLLRNGIRTRTRMLDLVEAQAVFQFLANVYVEELHRPKEAPLDPVAVGTWGVALFTYGLRDDVKQYVIDQIRQSPEYRTRNGE